MITTVSLRVVYENIPIIEDLLQVSSFGILVELVRHGNIWSNLTFTQSALSPHYYVFCTFLLEHRFHLRILINLVEFDLNTAFLMIVLYEMPVHRFFTVLTWVVSMFAKLPKHVTQSLVIGLLIELHLFFLWASTHGVYLGFHVVLIHLRIVSHCLGTSL